MNAKERGLNALKNHLQVLRNMGNDETLISLPTTLGMTAKEFERVKSGERLLNMQEFHNLLDVFCPSLYIKEGKLTWINWFLDPPTFLLVGILEPSFSLKKMRCDDVSGEKVQAFVKGHDAIILDPFVPIEEGDSLFHVLPNGMLERLVVEDVKHSLYSAKGDKPTYQLFVSRYKPNMKKDREGNITYIGGDVTLGANAHLNMGSVVDNSTNTLNDASSEIFEKARILIETIDINNRQEILEIIARMKEAIAAGDKNQGIKWYQKFFNIGFVADLITLYPAIQGLCLFVAQYLWR